MKTYDHIILGSGQATGTLLGKLIPSGDRIAVIEADSVGGSCVNFGCTPTKTLVASARAIHQARCGDHYGFKVGNVQPDYARIRERMNEIRNGSRKSLVEWMTSSENVDLIRGWGKFTGPRSIRVGEEEYSGKHIYINTGTRAAIPDIPGIDTVTALDSAGLLELTSLPEHLVIIGGGYIGIEFAQIYRRFGASVTILQRDDQLMPEEDEEVGRTIREILEAEGVRVLLEADTRKIDKVGDQIRFQIEKGDGRITLEGTHLLVATGRRPNSTDLELETAGIQTDEKDYIKVDDYCRTNVENVYAVGDVNGRGAFTHTSVNDAEIVLDLLNGGNRKISDRIPIYALFSDPPLGRVGLSEKAARQAGRKFLKSTKPMQEISRAKEMGATRGFAKLLVDPESSLIIGATVFGPGGDEIINMFAAIMYSQIPCYEYRKVVLVHPTVSELMPWMLDGLEKVE
ncbi:mercuric reductase [Flavilitoribacter nigricans]|uniref:Mercuric reductase n=1 Tax=Flavilitoribacter nigricans (strain ATCC 23147 / DSM 23189 / NBRC 102662 / NCIMB 1420 / SS-2) TaxID=1122177 RepID=A0A2D0N042_FLAN2|nr:mercuric reductase [Flavilitoribacter nigricans]PHN01800.1 mercuric reductase [Flavilitoribacter nigricans DSM 23189 = NBRC 102662]